MSNMSEEREQQEEPRFVTQTFGIDEEEDYAEDRAGVPIRCQFCVGQSFRRSRLRGEDLRSLLLMRYPVRCLRCSQRQLVSFTIAGISLASHVRPQKKRRSMQQKAGSGQRPPAGPPAI
ncbi:MAG: hypothetical protein NVSMB3_01470 [Acidobacteriaceae bacterium]